MKNHKSIFFTSDWHVGHENSIVFDQRPFRDLNHMHETLIARYNATVPENGLCFFLGDIGNKTEDMRKVVHRLRGIKVLVLGNHDKGMGTMYNCGFDVVLNTASVWVADQEITMSHMPLKGIPREDTTHMRRNPDSPWENFHGELKEKNKPFMVEDRGQFHLHGHIHSRADKTVSKQFHGRQMDVGVCANNFTPVNLTAITSWVMKTLAKENE